jgi:hypothetical protein
MKRFVSYVTTGMLAGALAFPGLAIAQVGGASGAAGGPVIISSGGAPTNDLPMKQYSAFHDFHQAHPNIVRALARNPRLINSESFRRQHPALRDFLSQNPDFAEDFSEHPGDYVVPMRTPVRRHHHEMHAAARTDNGNAEANSGGTKAGAHASANASSNSAGAEPNGVPAATGEPGAGNSGAGESRGSSSNGNNM